MRLAFWIVAGAALLICGTTPAAHGQETRPSHPPTGAVRVDDPAKDVPLPVRAGAGGPATQATLAGRPSPAGSDPLDLKRLVFALTIVLGAMYVTHRVWKRLGMPGVAGRASGSLQVVSRLSLSPKQQLVLVRVGRRVVLVGNSGAQMNALCEISDPDEAAGLLGLAATEREESVSASFNSVLGGEEKRFEDQANVDVPSAGAGGPGAGEDPALASTRDELNDMMEKVRSLSRSFRPSPKGE